jgi:hypothetical protein
MCTAGGVQLGARGPPLVIAMDGGQGGGRSEQEEGGGPTATTVVVVLTLPAGGRRAPVPADFQVSGGGSVTAMVLLSAAGGGGGSDPTSRAFAVAVRLPPALRPSVGRAPNTEPVTLSLARTAAADVVGAGTNTTALAPPPLSLSGVGRGVVAVTAGVM